MTLPDGRSARFSQLYIERASPGKDGKRMRNRLCSALISIPDYYLERIPTVIYSELGIRVPSSEFGGTLWQDFHEYAELRDVLDCVTITSSLLPTHARMARDSYLRTVNRIFREENVGYRVDDAGVVHFAVDEEFELSRATCISALSAPRYAAVASNLADAYSRLDPIPPDGKQAARGIFGALESLFKLMFAGAPRLGGREIDQHLQPAIDRIYGPASADLRAANKFLASMKDWVEAAHFYRHEEGKEEPSQPPLELAVALISTGTGFLRWLAEIDQSVINGESQNQPGSSSA